MKQLLISVFICIGLYANGQANLIQDENFESADFTKLFYQTYPSVVYNQWTSFVDATLTSNTTISRVTDATRAEVAQMTNGATSIANASAYKAFIAQRLELTADAALYKLSFWAKATAGSPTARIFIKIAGSTTKFFIFDTGKPSTPSGTYTAFCKNLALTTSWQYFENVLDLSKTTTTLGSIAYNTAAASTIDDRTNFGICLQNNAANSTLQFDEVAFAKVDIGTGFSETVHNKGLAYHVVGNEVFVSNTDAVLDVFDVSGRLVKSISPADNSSFSINNKGVYLLKYKQMCYKIFIN